MRYLTLVLIATLLGFTGCTQNIGRHDLSGNVTFAGQPVPRGTIQFTPAVGNDGPGGFAEIVDGKYDTSLTGKGPTKGPHTVVIEGFDGQSDPVHEAPQGHALFDKFQTNTDVPDTGDKVPADFEVPAANKVQPPPVVNPNVKA